MYIEGLFRTKKYVNRYFLLITTVIMLSVSLLSIVIYFSTQNVFLDNEYETSKKIFYQIKHNVDSVDDTIKNLCTNLYMQPDIRLIMYDESSMTDMVNLTLKTNKLRDSMELVNPFIHSVCVYNGSKKQYTYISSNVPLFYEDEGLKDILENYSGIPYLRLMTRKIKVESGSGYRYEDVFTYILYDTSRTNHRIDNALAINIKASWLLDTIKIINMVEQDKNDNIYILDENNEFVETIDENLQNSLKSVYLKYKEVSNDDTGYFKEKINGEKYIINYFLLGDEGFTLLRVQPESVVFKSLYTLKINAIVITMIFLLLASFISIPVAIKVYRPIETLVKNVGSIDDEKKDNPAGEDEIDYLSGLYKNLFEKYNRFKNEISQNRNIVKAYWIRNLLVENTNMDAEQFRQVIAEYSLSIPLDGSYAVCVLKIDDYEKYIKENDNKNRALIKFNIINVFAEILKKEYTVEGMDMGEDHMVLIIGLGNLTDNDCKKLEDAIKKPQDLIAGNFRMSITASVGMRVDDPSCIYNSYNNALNLCLYRFIFGKMSIITNERVAKNMNNQHNAYRKELETELIACIKSADCNKTEKLLKEIFHEIAQLNYDNIIGILMGLLNTIIATLKEDPETDRKLKKINLEKAYRKIFELETLDEFYAYLTTLMKNILIDGQEELSPVNKVILRSVLDIINENYHKNELCLDQIADMLKINPRRVGKIFRETEGISVAEYINDLRLKNAAKLLIETELCIAKIIEKVGICNETYFYRMFKKRFGISPREYAQKKLLKLM